MRGENAIAFRTCFWRPWSASVTGAALPRARIPKVAIQSPTSGKRAGRTAPWVSVSVTILVGLGLKAEA